MAQTGLVQFGHRPRFFDASSPMIVPELNMQIWSGFKAIAYKYESGCNIVIDSCFRFMSTKTVLDRINDIRQELEDKFGSVSVDEFQEEVRKQLNGESVIANYANKRTYKVIDVSFQHGPCNTFFEMRDGQKISVAKYFYQTYKLKITDKR